MSKRRYLTGKEVQAMMQAVCYGATGARDYCLGDAANLLI